MFIITRGDSFGGAQVHVRDLSLRLIKDGHEVLVVTGKHGTYNKILEDLGITTKSSNHLHHSIRPHLDFLALIDIAQLIRQFNPDIISTHSSKAGILGRLAARLDNVPCLFTAHGWAFTTGVPEPQRTIYQVLERCFAPLADRVICVSTFDRDIGVRAGISSELLVTVHNGMPDITQKVDSENKTLDTVNVVMIARFDRQKDQETLLAAARLVPGCRITFVGDGSTLERIRSLAHDWELAERVTFLGHRSDIAEVLSCADVFALISHWEGFPRSTLEAMRSGLPVILSDVGGSAEAIEEGISGFVVPRVDVNTLAERLRLLVANAGLRKAMGEAARARYEQHFTFEIMYRNTLNVYQEVLNGVRVSKKRATER